MAKKVIGQGDMNRKRIVKIILGVIILVVLGFLLYKAFLLYFAYRITDEDIIDYQGTITVDKSDTCDVAFDGFTMCIPEGFSNEKTSEDTVVYADSERRFVMGSRSLEDLDKNIFDLDNNIDVEQFMKKYHFSTMTDVLHYYENHQNEKPHLFSKFSDIRDYYIIWNLVNVYLPEGDLYFIEGDYDGYLVQQKNNYYFYLYHNQNYQYHVSFGNSDLSDNYFTKDNVISILSSLKYED